MKRTHKFKELNDVAAVVAKAPNLASAAKVLGVDRSTLHRWIEAGKLPRPRSKPPVRKGETEIEKDAQAAESPTGWAAEIRANYALSKTDLELLDLAAAALLMAKTEQHARDRLAAMARFQQLVRQLNLDVQAAAAPSSPRLPSAVVKRSGDPRMALVK